jgi:hypothetical protein
MKKEDSNHSPMPKLKIFTLVIHLWRERESPKRSFWRGSITNIRSGETKYFQSISALVKLIYQIVQAGFNQEGGASQKIEKFD